MTLEGNIQIPANVPGLNKVSCGLLTYCIDAAGEVAECTLPWPRYGGNYDSQPTHDESPVILWNISVRPPARAAFRCALLFCRCASQARRPLPPPPVRCVASGLNRRGWAAGGGWASGWAKAGRGGGRARARSISLSPPSRTASVVTLVEFHLAASPPHRRAFGPWSGGPAQIMQQAAFIIIGWILVFFPWLYSLVSCFGCFRQKLQQCGSGMVLSAGSARSCAGNCIRAHVYICMCVCVCVCVCAQAPIPAAIGGWHTAVPARHLKHGPGCAAAARGPPRPGIFYIIGLMAFGASFDEVAVNNCTDGESKDADGKCPSWKPVFPSAVIEGSVENIGCR